MSRARGMILSLVTIAVLLVSSVAWAVNSHFIKADAGISGTQLTCTFKVAGLGDNLTDDVTCTANGTAVYACINNGGHHPSATNKETVNGPVSGHEALTSSKNGTIIGEVDVNPPGPGTFTCPPGQDFILASVTYSSIALSDSFGATATVTGSFGGCFVTGSLADDLCP